MQRDFKLLSLVVPFYNEQDMVTPFFATVLPVLQSLDRPFEIVCVNDGSSDQTLANLLYQQQQHPELVIVDFYKNFGKEEALTAGLAYARGEVVIPIDADLQDPPSVIIELVAHWREGADEVLAVRSCRASDHWIKRVTANIFYILFNKVSTQKIHYHAGDFRLLDRSIVDVVLALPEKNRFMKGIFSWAGNGNVARVEYVRSERDKGKSKFSYWRLWNFAIDGITSFSSVPLRIWSYIGFCISALSIVYMIVLLVSNVLFHNPVPGYSSIMCVMLFLGGVQLISLGVIGEYVARIFNESKNRPLYIVKKCYRSGDDTSAS